jgi:EAL domain-containing protein (putative c-di-GMP-specific phosphodiesterase class I)
MTPQDTFSKADILEGLEHKQFQVYYQPIINRKEGTLLWGEALVRWNHPRLGFLHPGSFIGVAEETGTIVPLGEFVLREACCQSKKWKDAGLPFHKVAINVSLAQLMDLAFPQRVFRIITECGADPSDIAIEVTESMAMTDPATTKHILGQLHSLGLDIMLDDFGTGYSSLSHLRTLPVTALKIDRQFVQQSLYSEKDKKLVHSIILLARALDLEVSAEGVETEEQLQLLLELECDAMQGFYFTHALSAPDYEEWCNYFIQNPALRV